MGRYSKTLCNSNIDQTLKDYVAEVEHLGESVASLRGFQLFEALKRDIVGTGPYPKVTLFEAANRVMTDLVILYGVRWLLKHHVFPFDTYVVEYGNDDEQGFDIQASSDTSALIGEAFNVAPSFFQGKKGSMLKKLRQSTARADFKLIMFNHDAVRMEYVPETEEREFFVVVKVGTDDARILPDHPM
ncbi:MAG: hypothetical protein ACLQNE_16080 [Thermoguttaceae bacterium]